MHQPFLDPLALPLEFSGVPRGPREVQSLPPGGGHFAVPHFLTFAQIANAATRTYRWTFDEALRHSRTNALAIRRDPVVMDALRSRQIPTAQLQWHIAAENDQDSRQADAAKEATAIIEGIPHFQTLKMHLLEALFWGRYASQLAWGWDFSTGRRRLKVLAHRPVHGDKLVFKYDGQVGILVHGNFPGTWEPTDRGRAHFLTPEERQTLIVHRHEPEDADFFEGELAGSIEGVGIRSRIYWFWWLRSQVQAFLMDYLERVGAGGFTVYFYEAGNGESLEEVKAAAEEQFRSNTILFPRYKDGSTGGPGIMRVEPSNAGAQLLQTLISGYFDEVIRRYILGQNLTTEARGTGLGSGVADLHADTFARLVKYDAIALAETLTTDLVAVIQGVLFPDLPPLRFVFDVDKPNAADVLASAQAFFSMGGAVDEDELRSIIGLAKPQPGHAVLSKIGSMSPAGMPIGVPMLGTPGPDLGPPGMNGVGPPMMLSRKGRTRRRYQRPLSRLEPDPHLLDLVRSYLAAHGLPDYRGDTPYHPVYPDLSRQIADYYQVAPHAPNDPRVQAAYRAMRGETADQFNWARFQGGIKFEPWLAPGQPYADSNEMRDDAVSGHLYYYLGGDFPEDSLIARPSGVVLGGHPHTSNDLFRAVHDLFGHALYGNQFGPRGEEHAWRTHSRMFSPSARPAMSFETRGQNSWVNFGPHLRRPDGSVPKRGDPDWTHPADRPYAEQKNNVLPRYLMVDE